jgi:4-alpha-glucanotransferase
MKFSRSSGILLHPTSLPGSFGIGDFGDEAYRFADFLVASGQSLWQVLPLGPTGHGNSPYACYSAFAGNTLLVSPQRLVDEGLLTTDDLARAPAFPEERVNFELVHSFKAELLQKAFERFKQRNRSQLRGPFESFCQKQSAWLDDYTLFRALKDAYHQRAWNEWDTPLVRRDVNALAQAREALGEQLKAQKFYQFLFFKQWSDLKAYCNERGIRIIGDIPIFVAQDSADVWTNPGQFKLDSQGRPVVVAGVPPDYFSATGQVWGNPLYHWDRMQADGFKFWIDRFRAMFQMVDILRIDHFRGFAACWEIPRDDKTAERGHWLESLGRELFSAIRNALGDLPIIAEDLGVITPDVEALLDALGFPGMRVMQFGFSDGLENIHLPQNYPSNVVAYTATHDSDTTVGWFNHFADERSIRGTNVPDQEKEFCLRYLHSDGKEINWDFINAVLASVADTAIVPLQDVLGLGTEARMNLPNTIADNWAWRYDRNTLSEMYGERLRTLADRYGRIRSPT